MKTRLLLIFSFRKVSLVETYFLQWRIVQQDIEGTILPKKNTVAQLSYAKALRLAQRNKVDRRVVNAMRVEHANSEESSPVYHRVEVKVNLGVALMQLGNSVANPKEYSRIYDESESLFLSALILHPGNKGAEQNLAAVRKNRSLRPTFDSSSYQSEFGEEELELHKPGTLIDYHEEYEGDHEYLAFDIDDPLVSYDEALKKAVQGQLDMIIVKSMRKELLDAEDSGQIEHGISVRVNLGTVLLNLANEADNRNIAEFLPSYLESEKTLESALAMQPQNPSATSNLAIVKRNILMRERLKLLNPHLTWMGHRECGKVALQRLQKEQLSATLFTCDDRSDSALLWTFHAAHTNAKEWLPSFRDRAKSRRELAYDVRSLVWRGDLCWISAVSDWVKDTEYMLFHCVEKERFLQQMEQSRIQKELLPLRHVRGGMILADRMQQTEKNWSPFVVGDELYITYRTQPHIVMKCDWAEKPVQLRCDIVQTVTHDLVP